MVRRCDDLPHLGFTVTLGARPSHGTAMPVARWLAVVAARFWALLVLTLVVLAEAGCGPHVPADPFGFDPVRIPPVSAPIARMPAGPIPASLKLPAGKGPFPAVIVLHGCAGLGPSQIIWAERLTEWGYAALIPDSLTPRGVTRVCEPESQPLVTPWDRVGDVGSAVAWLRTRKDIDPARIAVLGLSHGGTTAMLATETIYEKFRLRAAIDYYGPCVDPAAHGTVPLLVAAGQLDDWGDPARLCQAFAAAMRPGQVVDVHVYPGAYHAFDNPNITHAVIDGHVLEYNPAAATDSYARVHDFLDRWVKN
jgi:dienelactone hydrolase